MKNNAQYNSKTNLNENLYEIPIDKTPRDEISGDETEIIEQKQPDEIKQEIITVKQGLKELFSTTAPYTLSRALIASYNLLNGILFPYIDPSAVAAGPLIATVSTSSIGFSKGICLTLPMLLGNLMKQKKFHEFGPLIFHAWIANLLYAIPIMALFWESGELCDLLGFPENVSNQVEDYFQAFTWAVLPILWSATDQQILLPIKKSSINLILGATYSAVAMGVGYPLALGLFDLPEEGIAGIAWGAVASAWINFIALRFYFFIHPREFSKYHLFNFSFKNMKTHLLELIKSGIPLGLQSTVDWLNLAGISLILGFIGSDALSAAEPSIQLLIFYGFMIQALAQGIGVLTRPYLSQITDLLNNQDRFTFLKNARKITDIGSITAFAFSATLYTSCVFFNRPLCEIFLSPDDPDYESILLEAQSMLLISSLAFLLEPFRIGYTGGLRGFMDMFFSPFLSFLSMTLMGLSIGGGLALFLDWGQGWLFATRDLGIIFAAIGIVSRWFIKTKFDVQPETIPMLNDSPKYESLAKNGTTLFGNWSCCDRDESFSLITPRY